MNRAIADQPRVEQPEALHDLERGDLGRHRGHDRGQQEQEEDQASAAEVEPVDGVGRHRADQTVPVTDTKRMNVVLMKA